MQIWVLNFRIQILVRNIFGPRKTRLLTRKAVPISLLLLMMAYIFPIANKKLIYLMNVLQTNELSMIMAVSSQILFLKPM